MTRRSLVPTDRIMRIADFRDSSRAGARSLNARMTAKGHSQP